MENENIKTETTEQEIQQEIDKIKKRNKRVETDKARETSATRRIIIAILTYIVVVIYSILIKKTSNIFLTSLVPVIGFLLSTVSLKLCRKIREKKL
jgi:Flp pilus assembly protein TadB